MPFNRRDACDGLGARLLKAAGVALEEAGDDNRILAAAFGEAHADRAGGRSRRRWWCM